MAEIWTMGEMLVEIMRPNAGMKLSEAGTFLGPYPSGAPAIFIDTVARLNHSAGIIGGVGKDDFGKCLLDRLKKDGVDCSYVLQSDRLSTGCAFVTYFEDGSRQFIYHIGNTPAAQPKAPENIQGAKFFHIMGCSLMASAAFGNEIIRAMDGFLDENAKISFDPNIRPELLKDEECFTRIKKVLAHTSVLLPGVEELLTLSEKQTIEDAVTYCFQNPVLEVIVLKNGSKGCTVYTRNEAFSMGVYPVEAKDATGAGDCFDGAFLCGLLDNLPLREAARQATAAAALNTAAFGPMEGTISPENIRHMIAEKEVAVCPIQPVSL